MKIEADDPRSHVETITYTRSIVPGSVADWKLTYGSTVIRPDTLEFKLERIKGEAWRVVWARLKGGYVLSTGKVSTKKRHEDKQYNSTLLSGWRAFPPDVVEFIEAVLESKRTEQQL